MRASSWARTTTWRARSVNLSNTALSFFRGASERESEAHSLSAASPSANRSLGFGPSGELSLATGLPRQFSSKRPAKDGLAPLGMAVLRPGEVGAGGSLAAGRGLGPHGRKQHNLPDRGPSCEHHHKTVDAESDAARGRHSVLERAHEVLVIGLGLLVALRGLPPLLLESGALLIGVVQLAEGVRD